jgi:hypothetical protein
MVVGQGMFNTNGSRNNYCGCREDLRLSKDTKTNEVKH